MATILENYITKKRAIEQLQVEIQRLENDPLLKSELEFSEKLRVLMDEYGMTLPKINAMLDPDWPTDKAEPSKKRRERVEKIYKNPYTNEEIKTKGGNHRILRAWKEQFGSETVESWLQK